MSSIYHYTSGKALLNILQSQSFWATDIRFLNDYEELNRGLGIFEKFTENLAKDMPDDREHLTQLLNICVGNIRRNSELTLINLVSFSTEQDNLRQWMSYCNSGGGYCLEFDAEQLIPNNLRQYNNCLRVSEVEYLDSDLDSIKSDSLAKFGKMLTNVLTNIGEDNTEESLIEKFTIRANQLFLDSMLLASSIKPAEFSDEREVRLLYIGKSKENEILTEGTDLWKLYSKPNLPDIGFRDMNDLLVPYQPLPFNIHALKKIIIGPTGNMKLAELGLNEFRDRSNLKFEVVNSKCTLRRF